MAIQQNPEIERQDIQALRREVEKLFSRLQNEKHEKDVIEITGSDLELIRKHIRAEFEILLADTSDILHKITSYTVSEIRKRFEDVTLDSIIVACSQKEWNVICHNELDFGNSEDESVYYRYVNVNFSFAKIFLNKRKSVNLFEAYLHEIAHHIQWAFIHINDEKMREQASQLILWERIRKAVIWEMISVLLLCINFLIDQSETEGAFMVLAATVLGAIILQLPVLISQEDISAKVDEGYFYSNKEVHARKFAKERARKHF